MADEAELRRWWPNRFKPPWPFQSRFVTREEFAVLKQIRAEEREAAKASSALFLTKGVLLTRREREWNCQA